MTTEYSDEPPENRVDKLIRDRTSSDLFMREKIPVGILGATGSVGQRFIQLLSKHPWFEITAVAASEKSVGKKYKDATNWILPTLMPKEIQSLEVKACEPNLPCKIIFSALDSSVATSIEKEFANKGYVVVSNCKNHRMDPDIPLLIPEVNQDHVELVRHQKFSNKGFIVTNPNCSAIGLTIALKPLVLEFGVAQVNVVTMQATSGAGIPGVPSLAILDNVIPYIADEEDKLEKEPLKILGRLNNNVIEPYPISVSASCNRVPVTEGHLEVVSVKLKEKAKVEDVIRALKEFYPPSQELILPSQPSRVIHYFEEENYPQPKLQRDIDSGMAVSVGRMRPCPILDYKFVLLSHNTIRGGAGGAILIGELLVKKGLVFW